MARDSRGGVSMVSSRTIRRIRAFCLEGGTRRPRRVADEALALATPARRDVTLHPRQARSLDLFRWQELLMSNEGHPSPSAMGSSGSGDWFAGRYRWFRLEFLVGFKRSALKVELDVPGELRAKPALWQRQRAGTSRSTLRQGRSLESLSMAGTPHVERGWPFTKRHWGLAAFQFADWPIRSKEATTTGISDKVYCRPLRTSSAFDFVLPMASINF